MAISSEEKTKLLKVVVGLFDAAPGSAFLPELEAVVEGGMSIREVAQVLVTKSIFTDGVMGGVDSPAARAAVLAGHFGLTADDVEGSAATQALAYFTAGIEGGANIGDLVTDAVEFLARNDLPAEFAETATLLANKAAVAAAYSAVESNNSTDLADLQVVLQDPRITGAALLTQDEINQIVLDTNTDTFTLTADTDIATANQFISGLVFTPGGNDRINALQDEDVLTGVGDNPTLTATLGNANDNGATIITPTLNNIQTLNVAFTGSGGGAVTGLDMQDATGLTSVNITRVSQAVDNAEIGNITDSTVNELSVSNTNSNQNGVVEFSYTAGALAGENEATLEVDNVQLGWLNIGQNTSGIGGIGVGVQGYENLTLNSTGAPNAIGTLNIPMDTGTTGALTITGDTDLTLGAVMNAVNANNNALVEVENLHVAGTGVQLAGGRIATIDASALQGNLTIVLDNILDVGKAGTSGVNQDVSVIGGAGDDTFVLYDVVQTGDSITGGEGNDTLLFYSGSGLNSLAGGIENASMFGDGSIAGGELEADFDNLPDVTAVTLRNISTELAANGGFSDPGSDLDGILENVANDPVSFTLTNLTETQATGITVQHATTANNQIQNTIVNAAVKNNTANDTLGITLNDGTNVDPRFNFSIVTALPGNSSTIENITLADDDTESNSVELTNFAAHTGTITITGGEAGDFFNLDVDTAGADVAGDLDGGTNTGGPNADAGEVQQGLLGLDTDGTDVDATGGHFYDLSGVNTQVRLGAAVIDASASAADIILRVSTNAASDVGAQTITTGTGNDHVIFDNRNDTRAGLTISDTVDAGDGNDTLVIDGTGVRISLGASEWTNVRNFENLQIVGTSAAAVAPPLPTAGGVASWLGQNQYNLTLTNDLIQANGSGLLNIINDNDANNDQAGVSTGTYYLNTAGTAVESGVTIDARSLNAQNHFTYNGEEGAVIDPLLDPLDPANISATTADRFIFTDANINGGNIIDGGALDNLSDTNSPANNDVMEIRNTATVTAGDLQGISNIGTIAGVNDQATVQVLDLELTDAVIDALVDSYHTATTLEREAVVVRMNDVGDITVPVAGMGLKLDTTGMTGKTQADVYLDATPVGATVVDTIKLGQGLVNVNNFTAGTDRIELSVSKFGLTLDDDDIGLVAGTDTGVDGTNIILGAAAATATDRIIIDGSDIYFDADGSGAGAQVKIAEIVGVAVALTDIDIVA
ncbi:MAG: hypothetical protein KF888_04240 [Nitrosomonas sp.]|nr:hypothetical protein [Nitrosomonas sp.]